MPAAYTYPGVYIEELPSGVRTIVGVSTAETAFVDVFARGPVDEAVRITSFADFERTFGGLHPRSEASYAIRQYYLNGGRIAWVVRIAAGNPGTASLRLTGGSPPQDTLDVVARNPGAWGNDLQAAVVDQGIAGRFDLVVQQTREVSGVRQVVATETHRNLSMVVGSPQNAVEVVNAASALIRLTDLGLGELPVAAMATSSGAAPSGAFAQLTNGDDGNAFTDDGDVADDAAFASAIVGSSPTSGLRALDRIDPFIFNILCLPASSLLDATNQAAVLTAAEAYCLEKRAFLIVDIPEDVATPAGMVTWMTDNDGLRSRNAAVYFPRVRVPDPLNGNRLRNVGPSGTLAGVFARTDATRGVWKAPAGTEAGLRGARIAANLTDDENGGLNPLGINVLRNFPIFGNVSWGARTLDGADRQASEWKYVPIRRTALYLEESLFQGLKWVVFEPNDEPLWSQIRLNVGAFMHGLFRQGAFQGTTPREAYFVKCDSETTTQADIDRGVVNILVGFAPLKPAEFVVIQIQQIAGQLET
jgi:phage tail sheath protein FI